MNPKTTGLLFVVAAALAAFVYFYEIGGESERLAVEEAGNRIVVGLEPDDVEAIELTTTDGVAVSARRSEGAWEIVEPLAYPADAFVVDAMAAAIAQLGGGAKVDDPQALDVYGLAAVEREVRFSAGGEERALRIGDPTPLGSNSYVTLVGSDEIHAVASAQVAAFAKAFDDIRQKQVIDFDREAVRNIAVNWPDGGVVLQRIDTGRPRWNVIEPVKAPGDDEAVTRLLSSLAFLRADGFVDEPPSDAEAGLERPMFAVRLTGAAAGDVAEPFEVALEIGSRVEDGARLVRGAQPGLYRLNEDRLEELPTTLSAYRDKQLSRFTAADAQRVEILFSSEGSSVALTAVRGEAGWTSEPEAFGAGQVDALVGALADLRAVDIAAEALGEAELAGVGLAPANVVYRVLAAPPDDGGEARVLALVRLGALQGAEGVLARRANDDTVYVIGLDQSEYLPISYEAFGNRFRAQDSGVEPAAEPAEGPAASPPPTP